MAAAKDEGARRARSLEERQRIVAEALAPGASVAAVARRHGLNANLDFQMDTAFARGLARSAARAAERDGRRDRVAGAGRAGLRSR